MNLKKAQRMVDMIDFLETEAVKENFDMGSYLGDSNPNNHYNFQDLNKELKLRNNKSIDKLIKKRLRIPSCGTSACAWGCAPLIWPRSWKYMGGIHKNFGYSHQISIFKKSRKRQAFFYNSDGDIEEWFGITWKEANHLFDGDRAMRRSLKREIQVLKTFLKNKEYEIVEK